MEKKYFDEFNKLGYFEKYDKKYFDEFDEGITNPHDYHIVREKAPSTWPKKYQDYVTKSQKIIDEAGIGLNDDIRNFTRVQN